MTKRLTALTAAIAALTLTGCPGPTQPTPSMYGPTPGPGYSYPSTGASSAPTAAPTTGPMSGSTATNPVAGIGLSSFFDTYNFNFPVPEGQALGSVANLSHAYVAPEGGKVYLQIGLQTTDKSPTSRQPLNVSFVFDRSGSMSGEKIAYARMAAQQMIDKLDPQDTFSLVAFDSSVNTVITPGFATDKAGWMIKVNGIDIAGGTNIDAGLTEGYKHVHSGYKADAINRVILMSDGEATEGETSLSVLGQRAAGQAAEGVSLSTIGVGTGFKEDFMTSLAREGKGTFYFVNSAEDANKAFSGEVMALQRTVARNVKLAINVADGVKVLNVYGHTSKTEGQSLNVDSNDLSLSQSKVILLELQVPEGASGTDRAIADVAVDYDDVVFGGHKQARAEAKVGFTADAAKREGGMNSQIASSVIILQTASVLIRAAELIDQGQRAQAKAELLQQFETVTVKATELKDEDLKNEAANLKLYVDRFDSTDAEVLKKELQYDAFQKQQGKKKVVQPA